MFKYYGSYDDELEDDILYEIDYFQLLDRYYRYGITFEDSDLYPKKRIMYEKDNFKSGVNFEDFTIYPELLYVYENFDETPPFRHIVRNRYDLRQLLYNDVKKINLDDVDKGPISISEIEKWKRRVINKIKDRKTRLRLLDPNIYHSLIIFIVFYNFKGRPHNKIDYDLSYEGIDEYHKNINNYKNKYICTKIYEDKIYNKIRGFFNKNNLIK